MAGSCEIYLTKGDEGESRIFFCFAAECRKTITSKHWTDSFFFSFLSSLGCERQKLLEQSIQSAQEIEKSLQLIQEFLSSIDKQLAAYIADKVDAASDAPRKPRQVEPGTSFFGFYYLTKTVVYF